MQSWQRFIGVIYVEGHLQISKKCAQISPKKYPWYAQTMPKKCPTYAQDMPKIYLRYPEICQWCAKDIPEICHQRIFGKDIPKICLRSQICPRYAQDIPKICQRFQKPEWLTHSNMDPKDASASKKLRQKNTSAIRFSSFPRSTGEVKSWELMTDLGGKGQSLINRY